LGIWGAMGGAGGAAGVLLGGVLTDLLSWRWILFINVPIGLLAALASQRLLLEGRSARGTRDFDLRGALSATIGLSLVVLGIVRSDQTGWGNAVTLGLIVVGLGLLGAFIAIEGRFAHAPLMPLRLFRARTLSAANVVVLLIGAATFAMWFFLSLYLQQVLGYSPIRAGLAFLPMTICIVIGSTGASRGVSRFGARPLLIVGMLMLAIGLAWFSQIPTHGAFLSDVLGASLLAALGMGLAYIPATICAVSGVARSEAGLASGVVNTSRLFGGALGLALLAAIATSHTDSLLRAGHVAMPAALTSGFRMAFAVAAGISLAGVLVAVFGLPRRVRRPEPAAGHASEPVAESA
ncbi:MAG: MFS transporter, partial [Solirubrobacteraceae bacterium]